MTTAAGPVLLVRTALFACPCLPCSRHENDPVAERLAVRMDYYRVTVEVFSAGNPQPESHYNFLVEAAADEIWREAVRTGTGEELELAEREVVVTEAVEEIAGEFLEAHQLLSVPLVGTATVRRVGLETRDLPGRGPDLARVGIKLWHLGS